MKERDEEKRVKKRERWGRKRRGKQKGENDIQRRLDGREEGRILFQDGRNPNDSLLLHVAVKIASSTHILYGHLTFTQISTHSLQCDVQ